MRLVAHRGLHSKNTKENTLDAILLGDRNKDIDGVEIDVRLTKDNKVVVIHDDTIDRTSNGSGMVRVMSLDRLKRFNYGSFLKRSTISTLEEVLDKFSSNTLLIIELKDELDRNEILASRVVDITSKYPNINICFKSFSREIVGYLQSYSNRPVGILINKENTEFLNIDANFYSISKHVINSDIIKELKEQNKIVMVWTINSKEEMELLKQKIGNYLYDIYVISDNPRIYRK